MTDGHKTPSELVDYMIKTGIDKATKPLFKLMLLGIFGGAFIALGGAGNIISGSTLVKTDQNKIKKADKFGCFRFYFSKNRSRSCKIYRSLCFSSRTYYGCNSWF